MSRQHAPCRARAVPSRPPARAWTAPSPAAPARAASPEIPRAPAEMGFDGTRLPLVASGARRAEEGAQVAVRATASGGVPLSPSLRAHFEPRFGRDLGAVRLHTGAQAEEAARAVRSRAYTIGRDIAFAAGEFAPDTTRGQRLLAHELTHVIQQSGGSPSIRAAPTRIMRTPCEEECGRRFERSEGDQNERIAQLQFCLHHCERPPPPPRKPPPPPKKPAPKHCRPGDVPEPCQAPKGPGVQPSHVSQELLDRMMGRYEGKDGDPGEGCRENPYVAGPGEKVCTIAYGHQIRDCPVLSKATGQRPTKKEQKAPGAAREMYCACAGTKHVDCKGPQAEQMLRGDVNGVIPYVHRVVPVDLDQAQLDALVDLTLSAGHIASSLVTAIKKYWCTDVGKDKVRQIYLRTSITQPQSRKPLQAFIARRRYRVWPPRCRE